MLILMQGSLRRADSQDHRNAGHHQVSLTRAYTIFPSSCKVMLTCRSTKFANQSLQVLDSAGRRIFTFTPANPGAYPQARFWMQEDWTQFTRANVGQTPLVGGGNAPSRKRTGVDLRYLTDEASNPITGEERSNLRITVMKAFHHMEIEWDHTNLVQQRDPPPATWGRSSSAYYTDYLRDALEREHPWVRLCAHAWKVRQIGIDFFPQYRLLNKAPTVEASDARDRALLAISKQEEEPEVSLGEDPTAGDQLGQVKRSAGDESDTAMSVAKKARLSDPDSGDQHKPANPL